LSDLATWPMPQVNMNGTSRADLLAGYMAAHSAVDAALNAVANAAPHGRDYQTLADGAWRRANSAHINRCVALNDIRGELEAIILHLADV
jgi:hypothetical protein